MTQKDKMFSFFLIRTTKRFWKENESLQYFFFFESPVFNISPQRRGFPGSSNCKESACDSGGLGLIPGSGRSPREGHGDPLQCPCLENPADREAWQAIVHGTAKSWTQLRDLDFTSLPQSREHSHWQRGNIWNDICWESQGETNWVLKAIMPSDNIKINPDWQDMKDQGIISKGAARRYRVHTNEQELALWRTSKQPA